MTSTKLDLNSEYLFYTTYGTISNQKAKIVGILNYAQTDNVAYSISALAINEKVVDTNNIDTSSYFEKQLFYHCVYQDDKGNDQDILLWDDVIDFDKTTKLTATYEYTLSLAVDTDLDIDISTIEQELLTHILNTYKKTVTPKLVSLGTTDSTEDETTKELNKYKELFESAKGIADKLAKLEQIETLIEYFANDDMIEKILDINSKLDTISDTVNTISVLVS